MRFAGSGAADQHDIALGRQERSALQRAHQFLVDRAALEHERAHILDRRQLGSAHPVADGGGMAVCGLGAQQIGQDFGYRALALYAGVGRLVERADHPLEAEPAHGMDHLMPLHGRLAGCHSARSRRSADAPAPGPRA